MGVLEGRLNFQPPFFPYARVDRVDYDEKISRLFGISPSMNGQTGLLGVICSLINLMCCWENNSGRKGAGRKVYGKNGKINKYCVHGISRCGKDTTESQYRIDIRWLNKQGYLKPCVWGSLSWSSRGKQTGCINYRMESDRVESAVLRNILKSIPLLPFLKPIFFLTEGSFCPYMS